MSVNEFAWLAADISEETRQLYERGELLIIWTGNARFKRQAEIYQKLLPKLVPWEEARAIMARVGPEAAGDAIKEAAMMRLTGDGSADTPQPGPS